MSFSPRYYYHRGTCYDTGQVPIGRAAYEGGVGGSFVSKVGLCGIVWGSICGRIIDDDTLSHTLINGLITRCNVLYCISFFPPIPNLL